eukprot:5642147-Lingulodinium_polyedra.AAC.1
MRTPEWAASEAEVLGLRFVGRHHAFAPTRARAWRLRLGLTALLHRRRLSPDQLQRVVGHL